RTVIAAVAILGQALRTPAFEVSAAQIVERQTHGLGKGFLIKSFLHFHPLASHLIHSLVEVVLVEILCWRQATSRCQPGALGLRLQTKLGTGKEQPGIDHRLEQSPLAWRTHRRKKTIQPETSPTVIENG